MSDSAWILVAGDGPLGGAIAAARPAGGTVTAAVVGSRDLAEAVAAAGPDTVLWLEPAEHLPAEAHAEAVADAVARAAPRLLLSTADPASRVLLGAAAARIGAAVIDAVRRVTRDGDALVAVRSALGGRTLETLQTSGPLAGIFDGRDAPAGSGPPAPIETLACETSPGALRVVASTPAEADADGLRTATRVVGAGAGLHARTDLALVEGLASALGAELGCTMPVADLGWLPEDRCIGRSGQHIAPALYVAVGVSGQPQHLVGVQDAGVVVGIDDDPGAPIFRHCDYGIVGDLYEVLPALTKTIEHGKQEP